MRKVTKLKRMFILFMALSLVIVPVATVNGQASPGKILDSELVISTFNDDGEIAGVQVLNHIRVFGTGNVMIEDKTNYNLSSIRNMYSTEKVSVENGTVKLQANVPQGAEYSDVYYLAEVDQNDISKINMPVKINIEYFLDGQKISPSKLSGKSGHLKIVCHIENTTGEIKELEFTDSNGNLVKKEAEVYTPYVVSLSGWEFDNRKFSNISAPGVPGESPEGVLLNVQGVTQVSWSVPLVPPKYPASQYTVLEADGKDIELPSFKIGVIPIVPTTAEIDSLSTVQESLGMLYDGFDKIEGGVGAPDKDQTLLFGLNSLKGGLVQVSGGLGSLLDNIKQIRFGIANPAFNAGTFDTAKGTDASGNSPGVKDAVGLLKSNVDEKFIPAFSAQKLVLSTVETAIGTPADQGQTPSLSTSLYNDVNVLKAAVAGTPAEQIITNALEPKLLALGKNVAVFRDGGTLVTATGSMPFPASVTALELGANTMSATLNQIDQGLAMMVLGLGSLDQNGQPVKYMINGKPGSILYALDYLQEAIDSQMIPGINQLQDGTGQIGSGAGEAKEAIQAGLQTFESVGAIVSALELNASQADTFLGKADGAYGNVAYVFQTPEVSKQNNAMTYGLGAIGVALIILIALGRPPKQLFEAPVQEQA